MTPVRLVFCLVAFTGLLSHAPSARQSNRLRVAVHATGGDEIGHAFAAALQEAVARSNRLMLTPDRARVDADLTTVSTPVPCDGAPSAAIAIGAHRLGRARSSQWVNVIVTDEAHVREYAQRILADMTAALASMDR